MPVLDNFGPFITARVRGMKSGLLSRGELDAFIDRGDLQSMSEQLLSSVYETEMAEAMTRYTDADAIEDGVTRNLINTFSRLRAMCEGHYETLADIFLGRWDLMVVKALLRNRHHELDEETGRSSLMPGPSIPVAVLQELAAQDSMERLVAGLVGWNSKLCRKMAEELSGYQESRNLKALEEALDKSYFLDNVRRLSNNRDADSLFLRDLLRMEIDRLNLRILFEPRAKGVGGEDSLSRLLPRGTISDTVLRGIASASSLDRAVILLENTAYGQMTDAFSYLVQTSRFSRLDRAFELAFMDKLRRAAQQKSIGMSLLMYFGWLKFNEVMNLRMIAQGVAVELPKDRVREEMIYV